MVAVEGAGAHGDYQTKTSRFVIRALHQQVVECDQAAKHAGFLELVRSARPARVDRQIAQKLRAKIICGTVNVSAQD